MVFANIKKRSFSKVNSKVEKDKELGVYFTLGKSFIRANGKII